MVVNPADLALHGVDDAAGKVGDAPREVRVDVGQVDDQAAPSAQLVADAQTRWQNSLAAHQDALRVQAGVVQALETSRSETNGLVSSSQSAVGILQANQAGNQLIALQTRQLVDLTALIAAQSRAQSLDGARLTANQEQGRVQLDQFLNTRRGYQPQTVQMFHQ